MRFTVARGNIENLQGLCDEECDLWETISSPFVMWFDTYDEARELLLHSHEYIVLKIDKKYFRLEEV